MNRKVHSVRKFPIILRGRLGRYVLTRRKRLRCKSPGGPTLIRTVTLDFTSGISTGVRAVQRVLTGMPSGGLR